MPKFALQWTFTASRTVLFESSAATVSATPPARIAARAASIIFDLSVVNAVGEESSALRGTRQAASASLPSVTTSLLCGGADGELAERLRHGKPPSKSRYPSKQRFCVPGST